MRIWALRGALVCIVFAVTALHTGSLLPVAGTHHSQALAEEQAWPRAYLSHPWVIGGIVATAVAVPIALHDDSPGPNVMASLWTYDYRWGGFVWGDEKGLGYKCLPPPELGGALKVMNWQEVAIENLKGYADADNVTATIDGIPLNIQVLDGQVSVGDIPTGSSAWSRDTFQIVTVVTEDVYRDLCGGTSDTPSTPATTPSQLSAGITWRIEYDNAMGKRESVSYVPQIAPSMTWERPGGPSSE